MHGKIAIGLMGAVCLIGCGPEERARGTGASGRLKPALDKPDVGFERINKLSESEQKAFDLLHRKFSDAVVFRGGKENPTDKPVLDKVRAEWDRIIFGRVKEDERYSFRLSMKTDLGALDFFVLVDTNPDHCRNIVALAKSGYFDGKQLSIADERMEWGPSVGAEMYTLPGRPVDRTLPKLCVYGVDAGKGQVSGQRFGICLAHQKGLAKSATPMGLVTNNNPDELFAKLSAAKPEARVIRKVDVVTDSYPLFQGGGTVALPKVGADGKLVTPGMFPGMEASARGAGTEPPPTSPAPPAAPKKGR